jgi:LDH2 family malate/lactate/ureidoglycolate dehydrogenase
MVEVLCGVLAGSNFSTKVRKWTHSGADSEANLGQFFMALDPKCFAPGFTGRMSEMNEILRNLTPVDPLNPVLVAGDPERLHMKKVDSEGGVEYSENQIKTCQELSERLGVSPIKFIN